MKKKISREYLEQLNIDDLIEDIEIKTCDRYSFRFIDKRNEAKNIKDESSEYVFNILSMITSFSFKPEFVNEPFAAKFIMQGSRSAIPDDLTKDQIHLLKITLDVIRDPELLSRISDTLWIKIRDYKNAINGINAYLESAKILKNAEQYYAVERLERALRLSYSLGKGGTESAKKVIVQIETLIDEMGYDDTHLVIRLMDLLLSYNKGKADDYDKMTNKLAIEAEEKNDWEKARACWTTNAKWNAILNNNTIKRRSLIKAAETHVKQSKNASSNLLSADCLHKAIEAYRRIGNSEDRIQDLHDKLLSVQGGIRNEMASVSSEFDMTKVVDYAISNVKQKDFNDALNSFCLLIKPIDKKVVRDRVMEMYNK